MGFHEAALNGVTVPESNLKIAAARQTGQKAPMSEWYQAKVFAVHPAADGLTSLELDVRGTPLTGSHREPGQYVGVSLDALGQGLFAIASEPGPAATFELLIKEGPPLAEALGQLKPGQTVRVTMPTGKGFPVEKAKGKNLLLFATGSGISAIRSVVLFIRRHRDDYGNVRLYFGARTPTAFAYKNELDIWENEGIEVVRTVSRPGESGWKGLTGYVQSHLSDLSVDNAIAFLCGQRKMVADVSRALTHRGLRRENIYLNL